MKLKFPEGEKVLYQDGPKGEILVTWFFKSIFYAAFFGFFSAFLLLWLSGFSLFLTFYSGGYPEPAITYNYLGVLIVFIVSLVSIFLYHAALRKTYKYYITNERIIFEGGILLKRIRSIPYHKVTDVSISQNIIERFLKISKVNVHTAGTGTWKPEIQFVGLTNPEEVHSIIIRQLKASKSLKHTSAYNE